MKIRHELDRQKRHMLEEVDKMKRFGKFTKQNMIAHGFIDSDIGDMSR